MSKQSIAIQNVALYLMFLGFAFFAWRTKDWGAAAYAAGGALGVCLFIPGFPLVYTSWLFIKKFVATHDTNAAKAEAKKFWKLYFNALLFTPIVNSRK